MTLHTCSHSSYVSFMGTDVESRCCVIYLVDAASGFCNNQACIDVILFTGTLINDEVEHRDIKSYPFPSFRSERMNPSSTCQSDFSFLVPVIFMLFEFALMKEVLVALPHHASCDVNFGTFNHIRIRLIIGRIRTRHQSFFFS